MQRKKRLGRQRLVRNPRIKSQIWSQPSTTQTENLPMPPLEVVAEAIARVECRLRQAEKERYLRSKMIVKRR